MESSGESNGESNGEFSGEFCGLGSVEVRSDGVHLALGGAKQRGLLALLMLEPGRVVPLQRIADSLWPDAHPVPSTLYRLASRVRGVFVGAGAGEQVVVAGDGGYRLEIDPHQVDIHRFEHLTRLGRSELAAGRPDLASALLGDALALWRGPALTGTPDPVRHGPGSRLEELRLLAFEARAAAELALGRHDQILPDLREWVAAHPCRERLIGMLMTALQRDGRRPEALELYRSFRCRMVAEQGLEPGELLREIQRSILADEPDTVIDVVLASGRALPAPPVRSMSTAGPLDVRWSHSPTSTFE